MKVTQHATIRDACLQALFDQAALDAERALINFWLVHKALMRTLGGQS